LHDKLAATRCGVTLGFARQISVAAAAIRIQQGFHSPQGPRLNKHAEDVIVVSALVGVVLRMGLPGRLAACLNSKCRGCVETSNPFLLHDGVQLVLLMMLLLLLFVD
jgi:hypothetical protein